MFIQTIAKYLNGYDLNITIRSNEDGTITVIMVPKPRAGKEKENIIPPVSATAKPEFFDSPEFISQFVPFLTVTKDKLTNINLYTESIEKIEKKKKEELDKKKTGGSSSSSSSNKKSSTTIQTKKETKQVPNPDYIPPDQRNEENLDYDPDTYDEDEPEFIEEEVEVPTVVQKTLI